VFDCVARTVLEYISQGIPFGWGLDWDQTTFLLECNPLVRPERASTYLTFTDRSPSTLLF